MANLSLIPSLSTDQILTIPFHSAKRNRSTEPLILTSPKYIFKRGNGDQISEDIRNRGTMRLELTRKDLVQNQNLCKIIKIYYHQLSKQKLLTKSIGGHPQSPNKYNSVINYKITLFLMRCSGVNLSRTRPTLEPEPGIKRSG